MSASAPAARSAARLRRLPPQALFVLGAMSQYVGAALAVLLFAKVPAAGVAWLRIVTSAVVLVAWRRPWQTRWTAARLRLVTAFGVTLAFMNVSFYLAIDRLPLGTAVAIEFCGPIAVAALGSRTRRDAGALALATVGVLALADVHFAGSPAGLAFAFAAGGAWAAYVVLGHRMAADTDIRPQDGLALGMAIGALAFAPILLHSAVPALVSPLLLAACVAVGILSSAVPYVLEQVAFRRLARARFALLLALLPATAAIVGTAILGQVPGLVEAGGIALVVCASLIRSHESL
ncbi:MAG: inner rane transporter RhtA [Solirubrobacteraceae bacterium]|nr:inner rane transporter RhtA [Solirubrobacteraceae bacterium]